MNLESLLQALRPRCLFYFRRANTGAAAVMAKARASWECIRDLMEKKKKKRRCWFIVSRQEQWQDRTQAHRERQRDSFVPNH